MDFWVSYIYIESSFEETVLILKVPSKVLFMMTVLKSHKETVLSHN